MSTQSEAILENNLIKQLISLKYEKVDIKDDKDLETNLKSQLELHNKTTISDSEFKRVLNHLNSGTPDTVQSEVVETKKLASADENLSYCGSCGTGITKELKFCGNCGTAVTPK